MAGKSILDLAADFQKECRAAARLSRQRKSRGNRPWTRKIDSESLAVHPDQIPEVLERNRRHGLHIEYDRHGRPKIADSGQRRDLVRIEAEVYAQNHHED